ncbi:hydroxyectoine utilization dehydratase EutB [Thalassospiraceae bacterium LMO-JJ14]|nr:hydroxyectoine utilization dehydratase EutB [Thalassospiraceae bacterium LMO-JJ14]
MAAQRPVTLSDIRDAAGRIAGCVTRTPLRLSPYLSEKHDHPVRLKLETMQDTGAFKLRGATNALLALSEGDRKKGVIAVSTGNHGRGVAYAAQQLGIACAVYMSALVPAVKVDAIRALGAEVVITGRSQDEAEAEAMARIEKDGLIYIHPFDDPAVIAGQGTIGLEILEDMPDAANVIVPLSGGGLFAGIATAVKTMKPDTRMFGATMENGAAMISSLNAGKPVPVEEVESLADSLGGGIGLENAYTFDITRKLIDGTLLLSEAEIAAAMRTLFLHDRIVAEGGASVGVGALLSGRLDLKPGPTVIIVSGCNVDMQRFLEIVG